ncbi:MAG: preprotein translocase subunit Sec61beta [Nanoarchaeota archaeon]|nr:preprotein translocase subunit Sec61beta [Nanoarchaeota archaeon]
MAESSKIHLQGFGGIVRYDEEYRSKFVITPIQVIGFVVAIILLVLLFKLFWPIVV